MSDTAVAISVLHVDDEPDFADMTSTFLERADERLDVETATRAEECLDRLAAGEEVDCIVSDYEMPGQNGIELLEAVREEYPDLPFILFTGKGSEEVASDAISAGVSDYLQKGAGTDQYTVLANRIANLVRQRRAEARVQRYDRRQEESEQFHQRLLAITSEQGLAPAEKTRRLLELGVDHLGVENGHLVDIDEESGRHEVVSVNGTDIVEEGVTDLSQTYCRRTIESDGVLDAHDAPAQGWDGDPAYERFEIGCYVGKKLLVDGELYGTVCFVSDEPRDEPLSQEEMMFIDMLGRSLNQLLERRRRYSQLETVFQHTQDAIFLVDVTPAPDFRIRRVNRAYEDLIGLATDDLQGKTPPDVVGEEKGAEIEQRYQRCVDRKEPIEYEESLPFRGETIHLRTRLAPVIEEGEVIQLVGATREITG